MSVPDLPLIDVTMFHRYISHAPHVVDFFWNDFYANILATSTPRCGRA